MPFPSKRHELDKPVQLRALAGNSKRLLPDDDSKTHDAPGSQIDCAPSRPHVCAKCALAIIA